MEYSESILKGEKEYLQIGAGRGALILLNRVLEYCPETESGIPELGSSSEKSLTLMFD